MALTKHERDAIAEKERRLETPLAERVGVGQAEGTPFAKRKIKEHVSHVPEKWSPEFKHTKDGRCVVENRRQMNEYAKRKGLEWR